MKTMIDALNKKIKLLEDKIVKKDEKGGFPKELNDDKIDQNDVKELKMKKMKDENDFIEETARIRYQNVMLISRLEMAEEVEEELQKEIKSLEEEIE